MINEPLALLAEAFGHEPEIRFPFLAIDQMTGTASSTKADAADAMMQAEKDSLAGQSHRPRAERSATV